MANLLIILQLEKSECEKRLEGELRVLNGKYEKLRKSMKTELSNQLEIQEEVKENVCIYSTEEMDDDCSILFYVL